MPNRSIAVLVALVALGLAALGWTAQTRDRPSRPNILLIVADDLGYADLGVYGSEIRTPHIDSLAGRGVLFTQFHTAPYCAPSRAMLLSGNNNHVAGMGQQGASRYLRDNVPGYEGHLSGRIAPLPRVLRDAGYHTYSVGKWHLGQQLRFGPRAAGFERSFNLSGAAAGHFSSIGFYPGGSPFFGDGRIVDYPDGEYSTEVYTNRLLEFIESNRGDGKPFFAYAAYTSPHWPLQVPDDYLDRYKGRFDDGYDVLRERRLVSLKKAGVIPVSHRLPPRNSAITPWDDLSPEQQRREARKMELYAAMLENLDYHVGRLLAHLNEHGLSENTLIVFLSDNGAAAEDFYYELPYATHVRAHHNNSYENMGKPTSWVSYGAQWAEAGSAPFSRYKAFTRQGGIVAPMIIAGAGVEPTARISRAYATIMDIAPTLIDVAGAEYPASDAIQPMRGESMAGLLAGTATTVHGPDYVDLLYHGGRAFLRQGKWKIVTFDPPFDESKFELFDLEADPGETRNLAESEPERLAEMVELWRTYRKRLGIILPR